MYTTGIKSSFLIKHQLIGDFGEESIPHQHTYVVEWICTVPNLDENGFGVDIDVLTEKLDQIKMSLDNQFLNELPFFRGKQPSIETTARFINNRLLQELKQEGYPVSSIVQSEVRIWESDDAWASYIDNRAGNAG
jgi:6-pyruvoyltetrahydropterin/6-carboxytetrahydropterin synthase